MINKKRSHQGKKGEPKRECAFCNKILFVKDCCLIDISWENMQVERIAFCPEHSDWFSLWLINNGNLKEYNIQKEKLQSLEEKK